MKRYFAPLLLALAASSAFAGQFSVAPLRLDLTSKAPSGSVTITNDHTEPLRIRVSAVRWQQDAKGADSYAPTEDLSFFPQELEVAPGAKRVVRARNNAAVGEEEQAYRLFLEEVPSANASGGAAKIAVAVKFGVAVWLKPEQEKLDLAFTADKATADAIVGRVTNTGNTHVRLNGLLAESQGVAADKPTTTLAAKELKPWYLLPGASREVEFKRQAGVCDEKVNLVADTDEGKLQAKLAGPFCAE